MDLKTKLQMFYDKVFWVKLIKFEAIFIVLASAIFWVEKILFINFLRIFFDFLGSWLLILYWALTPTWFSIKEFGLASNWIQSMLFISIVHTIVYIYKLPKWVFWLAMIVFFGIVLTYNMSHMEPI